LFSYQYIFKCQDVLHWGDLKVTLSIGIATFPDDAREKDHIIENADQALYYAKHSGRNQVRSFSEVERVKLRK